MKPIDLKDVDLNLLVIFEAVFAAKSISQASVQLGMSQPAVSQALNRLRGLMDDPLFRRSKAGVTPTVRAEALIGPIRDALALIGRQLKASDEIDFATYRRVFRIIIIDVLEPILLAPVLREIDARAPHVSIESYPAYRFDVSAEILAGRIDLAVYVYPTSVPEIVTVPIFSGDAVVVARKGHPAIKGRLDAETFEKLGHVVMLPELRGLARVEQDLVAARMSRRLVYVATKLWSVPSMVQRTDLVGVLPRRFAQEIASSFNLELHETPVPMSSQHLYMMWNAKSTGDPGHTWLREALIAAAEAAAPRDVAMASGPISGERDPRP